MKIAGKKIFYILSTILAGLVLAAYFLVSGEEEVETAEVRLGNVVRTVEDTGYVRPVKDLKLYATQNAKVVKLLVEAGQAVKKGERLMVLENKELSMQLSETRSQLAQATASVNASRAALERLKLEYDDALSNLKRVEGLYEAGAVSGTEYEKARLQTEEYAQSISEQTSLLDAASAQESGLNQLLGELSSKERELSVVSPLDGVVLSLPVELNQVLTPGAVMASVALPDRWEVKADILSDDLAEVKVGQKAKISSPVMGQGTLEGVVKKIYPQAEEKQSALGIIQRRVPVIIELSGPSNLKPGYEVRVAIITQTKTGVPVVTREAVRTMDDGRKEVMAVVNNRVRHKLVETGLSDRENYEIKSGLKAGDRVVRDASLDLAENARVKMKRTHQK